MSVDHGQPQHHKPQDETFDPIDAVSALIRPVLSSLGEGVQSVLGAPQGVSGQAPKASKVAQLMGHMCEPVPGDAHTAKPDTAAGAPAPAIGEPTLADAGSLDEQVTQARTTLAQIENGVRAEDYGTRRGEERNTKGQMAEERSRAALSTQLCDLQKAADALRTGAEKRAFVAGVQKLLHDYLATPLHGSDDAEGRIAPEVWAKAGNSAGIVLTESAPSNKTIDEWQSSTGFVKYAVTTDGVMRVGPPTLPHQVIAGRQQTGKIWVPKPVLAAGVLHFHTEGDGSRSVDGVENTSGGFRPGPLRNNTALQALKAAGELPADPSTVDVHQNPTGDYDTSSLAVTTNGAAGAPKAHLPKKK